MTRVAKTATCTPEVTGVILAQSRLVSELTQVSLTIPIRTVSEANRREHWSTRAKRVASHRGTVGLALRVHLHRLDTMGELDVTLTRLAPRRLDSDNAVGSFKALRDGIADTLGVDDGDPRITWNYGQEKAKTYGVKIEIRRRTCES